MTNKELLKWAESVTAKDGGLLHNPTVMLTELARAILADNKHWTDADEERAIFDMSKIQTPEQVRNELLDELIEWHWEQARSTVLERTNVKKTHKARRSFLDGKVQVHRDSIQHLQQLKDRGEAYRKRPSGEPEKSNGKTPESVAHSGAEGSNPSASPPVRIELTAEWVDGQGITYSASNKDTLPEGGYAASHTSLNELSKTVAEGMKLMFDTDDDVPVEWVFGEGFEVSQDGRVGVVNLVEPPPVHTCHQSMRCEPCQDEPPTPAEIAEVMIDENDPPIDFAKYQPAVSSLVGWRGRRIAKTYLTAIISSALQIRDGE